MPHRVVLFLLARGVARKNMRPERSLKQKKRKERGRKKREETFTLRLRALRVYSTRKTREYCARAQLRKVMRPRRAISGEPSHKAYFCNYSSPRASPPAPQLSSSSPSVHQRFVSLRLIIITIIIISQWRDFPVFSMF